MDDLLRHPVVAPVLVAVIVGALGYLVSVGRKLGSLPDKVDDLHDRLHRHLESEERELTRLYDRLDEHHHDLSYLTGRVDSVLGPGNPEVRR